MFDMGEKLSKPNQSVEKTMKLVEILAEAGSPMKLQDIAATADMPASTTLRMVNTLLNMGYINQDRDTLQYSLSLKFTYIGEKAFNQVNLNRLVHPYLVDLSKETGECTCFAVEENGEVVYLDVISEANSILTVTQRIGKRAPMYCTGVGKLLLTNYSDQDMADYMRGTDIVRFTDRTITTPAALKAELNRIRIAGYALDEEECDLGAKCVAAPIRDYTGRVIAAISVTAPALRMHPERVESIVPIIKEAAGEISKNLAFQARP